tara:strand:+ start:171 stop:938 length:768 start_codon:yes stop_codon:yes gene_type:complete
MFKELYSFTVTDTQEIEEKSKEKRKNDKGVEEEVEVTKKVEKKIPVKFIFKEPSRRELEEADMEYSIEMSRCIKKGILTKAMLAKKYSDTGGLLSESDANKLVDLYAELADLEGDYTRKTLANRNVKRLPVETKKQIDALAAKVAICRRDIVTLESSYQTLFGHTADTKAQNRIILWYLTHLTYIENKENEQVIYFEGDTFDSKVDSYYQKEENEDSLFSAASGKLTSVLSYWYFSNSPAKEDFDKIINDIDQPS